MSSERRIRASRANGAKSRGPKTPESKRRSVTNNLRHGLLSRTVVLEDEDFQSFIDLLGALQRDLQPRNETERALVEEMAIARWRLQRLWAIERSTLETEIEKQLLAGHALSPVQARDAGACAALAFSALGDASRSLHLLNRYEARFHCQYHRSLTRLLQVWQASRPVFSAKSTFYHSNLVPNSDTSLASPLDTFPPSEIG